MPWVSRLSSCHFLPLPFWCPPTAGSQSHVPRAGYLLLHRPVVLTSPSNSQSLLLPPPPPPRSPSGPSPAQLSWSPRDTPSNNQAKESMGRGEGLQAGSLECLLWNKGSSRELESPWPPCCARKPGRASERAGPSCQARAPPPRPRPPSRLAGAARVPMQMSPGRAVWRAAIRARSGCPRRGGRGPASHGDDLGAKPWDSDAPRGCQQLSSCQESPRSLKASWRVWLGRRLQPKSFSLETYRNTWGLDWAGFRRIKERVSVITTIIIELLTMRKYWQ